MLKRYIKINGQTLPNPVSYSEDKSKISNKFQSEAGDDLIINVRVGKYTGSFTFHVSSYWKDKLEEYANMPSFTLIVDNKEYEAAIESISSALQPNSERCNGTQGLWEVTFIVSEI